LGRYLEAAQDASVVRLVTISQGVVNVILNMTKLSTTRQEASSRQNGAKEFESKKGMLSMQLGQNPKKRQSSNNASSLQFAELISFFQRIGNTPTSASTIAQHHSTMYICLISGKYIPELATVQ
jgi:hypothetical protein